MNQLKDHKVDVFYGNGKPLVSTIIGNRNDKCFCGSGLKFKKCCIDKVEHPYKIAKPLQRKSA